MRLRIFATALLLALALPTPTARAQNQNVSEGDKAAARQLVLDGIAALERRDFAGAADLFKRAETIYPAPTVLLGLARAQAGLGKLVSAQDAYNRLVHVTLAADAPAAFTKAIEDGKPELAALAPRVPAVVIQVHGAGAPTVTLDGVTEPAAVLGVKRPVDPGKHVITAVAPGYARAQAEVSVTEGKVETVTLDLVPGASDAPAAPGAPGGDTGASGSTRRGVGFGLMGAGGLGIVVGAVTMIVDHAKYNNLMMECPSGHCPSSMQSTLQGQVDSYRTLGGVALGGLVGGGVLAVTGVVVVLTAPRGGASTTAFAPMVGPGFVGAGAGGRF